MNDQDLNKGISCEEAQRLCRALVRGELDAEQRGRVKGHLLSCEACALVLGDAIDDALERGELTVERLPVPHRPDIPATVEGESKPSGLFKSWIDALKRLAVVPAIPAAAMASLAMALVVVSYFLAQEKSRATQATRQLQETLSNYQKTLTQLEQQNEQLSKDTRNYQAVLSELKQERSQPQIALSIYKAIPLVAKSGHQPAEPLRVEFTEKMRSRHLDFSFYPQGYKTYQIEIQDKDGTLHWDSGEQPLVVLEKDEPVIVSLRLDAESLRPGDYSLSLYGKATKKDLIARYSLQVRTPTRGPAGR